MTHIQDVSLGFLLMNTKIFTAKSNSILKEIITVCMVAKVSDPLSEESIIIMPEKFTALWDTGATHSCISEKLIKKLGLIPYRTAIAKTAKHKYETNVYAVTIILFNEKDERVIFPFISASEGIFTNEDEQNDISKQEIDVIIGMDIITKGDFAITNLNGKTIFSFRYPSIGGIDLENNSNY